MIDWWGVFSNGLWIAGLSLLLAALSHHDWLAHQHGRRLRDVLKGRSWEAIFFLSLTLVCLGLSTTSQSWWENLLWGILAASFIWQGVVVWRSK